MRIAVPLDKANRLFNHGPTTLIATAHGGQRNVMAAAWVMPIDFTPPKFAAVIAADTFTRQLLLAEGTCVLAAPTAAQVDLTWQVGNCTGRDGDKFAQLGIATEPASRVAAPLIVGCAAWVECRLLPEPGIQERYDLFVLEGLAAWVDDASWRDGAFCFGSDHARTIHHGKGGSFFATGQPLQARR